MREQGCNTATAASDLTKGLPRFQELSTSEQEKLMVTLYDDDRSMRCQFGWLITKTSDSIEGRVPVVDFARSILVLKAYDSAPGERDRALLDEHSEEIKRAGSISEIFAILCAYWNYLCYEILEYIIELHGTSDDIERLQNYEKELHKFFERRTFASGTHNEQICVMLNVREDITFQELFRIRRRIVKILHVSLSALIINKY